MSDDKTNGQSAGNANRKDEFVSRKLIRPNMGNSQSRGASNEEERRARPAKNGAPVAEPTHAEVFYYQKQMQSRTPVALVLSNGETVEGTIEWYDKHAIRLNRAKDQSNLLVYKNNIRYMYKAGEKL